LGGAVLLVITALWRCEEKIPPGPPRGKVMAAHLYTTRNKIEYAQWNNLRLRYHFKVGLSEEETAFLNDFLQWRVYFRVDISNTFDEVIDGTKWIEVKLKIWGDEPREWERHLSYTEINPADSVLLHPGKTLTLYTADSLVWDQTDDEGKLIPEVDSYLHYFVQKVIKDSLVRDTLDLKPVWVEKFWVDCDTLAQFWVDTVKAFEEPIPVYAAASVKLFREYEPIMTDTLQLKIVYRFPVGYVEPLPPCQEGFLEGPE